jgi:hypothetical protein
VVVDSTGPRKNIDLFNGTHLQVVASSDSSMSKQRIEDKAAMAKRGLLPISSYRLADNVIPGAGTVCMSHIHRGRHEGLTAEERVFDVTGSLAPATSAPSPLGKSSDLSRVRGVS